MYTPSPSVPSNSGNAHLGLIALVVAVAIAVPWYTHNSLTGKDESVASAWANVQSNLQRRADLIPNLLQTVSQAMAYESETLEALVEKQTEMLARHPQPPADGAALQDIANLDKHLSVSTQHLLTRAAALPELKATDQFLQLQAQLEGTENRINVARIRYNQAVRDYNSAIRGFIGRHLAEPLGMAPRVYFEASDGAEQPVKVVFGDG
ncbi:LemA family protein [Marinobacter sp. SS21]|uniref:LemA family protein n=1 Tax=Marinobacter sp. SS21 TaxID=2979460 RepID=UPI00232D8CAB|nr:LemA family protein [Marinobacter sp. SS21]MDC0662926.1 LemA family protein [Marinobacter sp. SS21]